MDVSHASGWGVAAVVLPVLVHEAQERVAVLVADVRTPTAFVRGPRHTDVLPRLHIGRGEQHERERERREDRQETGHDESRISRAPRVAYNSRVPLPLRDRASRAMARRSGRSEVQPTRKLGRAW